MKPRPPKHQPRAVTVAAADELHRYLASKANGRGFLLLDQRKIADEIGVEISRLHRLLPLLFADGRLRQVGTRAHGAKWVTVLPAPTESGNVVEGSPYHSLPDTWALQGSRRSPTLRSRTRPATLLSTGSLSSHGQNLGERLVGALGVGEQNAASKSK